MDIESLKTFITLATVNSFSRTAEQHHVVQSTVTNRIKELENELGKLLFFRDRKTVTLTNAGKHLLQYALKIVALKETAATELSLLGAYSAIFRIGSVHGLYDCHVHKYISNYINNHKDISVKITLDHTDELIQQLHDDIIDICFCYRNINYAQFKCFPFQTDEFVLVTSIKNNTYPEGIKANELKNITMLFCDFIINDPQDWFCSIFPKHYTFPLEIDIGSKLIPFLEDGFGYSLLPRSSVRNELEKGSLVEIKLLDASPPKIQSYVIVNRKKLNSKPLQSWFNLIRD